MKKAYGILLSFGLAGAAIVLSKLIGFNEVLLALILGIILGNVVKLPSGFESGIKFSSGRVLELAIVLMAFGINYSSFIKLGWQSIVLVVIMMAGVLLLSVQLAKKLKCPGSTGLLVGFGTAICGSSAIAALSPKITKDGGDIGIALAVVNLYGLLGMILIPLITQDFLTDMENGILLGSSLHSVGNVAGAGFTVNEAVGQIAITIKMGRVALLTPALLLFGYFLSNKKGGTKRKASLPWYLLAFIVISILVSFFKLPDSLLGSIKWTSSLFLSTAMAAIGLKMSFKSLASAGKKGLIFGGLIFAVQLAIIAILMVVLF